MKIIVTGAGGMLGTDVVQELVDRKYRVLPMTREELDITDVKAVNQKMINLKPDLIINCAAYTNVDQAESERDIALMVNGLGVRNLALACNALQIPLVQISTDYVFDGQKEGPYDIFDQPNPINVYGWSKRVGEFYVTTLLMRYYLIRTSWLFGLHGKNFVETILQLGQEQRDIKVVDDQIGSPTFTRDLARAMADLIETGCYGIYHITNQGEATWFQLATEVMAKSHSQVKVRPVKTYKYPRPAKRPGNSLLNSFPLQETLGYLLPGWQDAVERYLQLRKGGAHCGC